jgi:hypothetical protein
MGMLKSSAFNFDESRDYNLVNALRKSADLAPDIAEFLLPIGEIAKAQNLLWKGTANAGKVAKYTARLSKATSKSF